MRLTLKRTRIFDIVLSSRLSNGITGFSLSLVRSATGDTLRTGTLKTSAKSWRCRVLCKSGCNCGLRRVYVEDPRFVGEIPDSWNKAARSQEKGEIGVPRRQRQRIYIHTALG